MTRVASPLTSFEVHDVEFSGFAGDPVLGCFIVPAGAGGPLPTVVQYNGYNGGRGLPQEHLAWPAAGYAHFFMDTRAQGSGWGQAAARPSCTAPDPRSPGS